MVPSIFAEVPALEAGLPEDPPSFLTSPGQVGFTPNGRKLIVTTKASRHTIEIYRVRHDGRLSRKRSRNPSATPVPFAFTFDPFDPLVVGEAATSSVTTYEIRRDRTLTNPQSQSDGQMALCWIVKAGDFYYATNTGSNNVSGYRIDRNGRPSLIGPTGVVATTGQGPIDMTTGRRALSLRPDRIGRNGRRVPCQRRRHADEAASRKKPLDTPSIWTGRRAWTRSAR